MVENNESSRTNNYSLENNYLSLKEKKSVFAIAIFSFLIFILFGLIVEAYINQHPVFAFLQYKYFKPESIIIGSLSAPTFYIGVLLLCIADNLFRSKKCRKSTLLIPSLIGLIIIFISLVLSFISYNWLIEYSRYRYFNLALLVIIVLVKLTTLTDFYKEKLNTFKYFDILSKLPLSILIIIGLITGAILS